MQVMSWRARLPRVEDISEPVHDADSLWLESDQGDWYRKVRDCRLWNVYGPELRQTGGQESRLFTVAWINKWNAGRWPFWVDTLQTAKSTDIMTFGRYVTIVWNANRTVQLNTEIQAFIDANGYPGGTGGS